MMSPMLLALLQQARGQGAESAVGSAAEHLVLQLLYQVVVILLATRLVIVLVRPLWQTDVSGEILAGILLGPSLLGMLAPGFSGQLFHADTSSIFVGIAQIGLVLLMFQIGLEFEFKTHLGRDKLTVLAISAAGIVLPFALGYLTAPFFWSHLPEPRPSALGFRLFFSVAMSITAIPVLGRIFMELRLAHTRTAALTIGAAAVDDVSGWLLLGTVALIVRNRFSFIDTGWRVAALAGFLALLFIVGRPLLKRAVAAHLDRHGTLRLPAIAWILLALFAAAVVTSNIGVFAIIGGFAVGVALHDDRRFVQQWKEKVGPLVQTFFLPLFFAYTGLRTDIGSLDAHGWWLCLLVIVVAFGGKLVGAFAAARLMGEDTRKAATIGVCMNTRGMMELIVLNIGKDMGLLPPAMFTMLVIMALVSTFMATPLIRVLMRSEQAPDPEAKPAVSP
jgi:Kef-type K+ transport system membrane component KefB